MDVVGEHAVCHDGLVWPRIAGRSPHDPFGRDGVPRAVDKHLVLPVLDAPLDVWADYRIIPVTALSTV